MSDDFSVLAENAATTLSGWELHGVVCGLAACRSGEIALQDLLDLVGVEALTDQASVEAFVGESVAALVADDLSFALLLPDDDVPLELRMEALADWSGAFLAGLGAGLGSRDVSSLPEEAQEVIDDFSAITELDAASADEGESAETDLLQLQEFVKVGVLLIMGLVDAAE